MGTTLLVGRVFFFSQLQEDGDRSIVVVVVNIDLCQWLHDMLGEIILRAFEEAVKIATLKPHVAESRSEDVNTPRLNDPPMATRRGLFVQPIISPPPR